MQEYSIHGLRLASDIELPELALVESGMTGSPDFEVITAKVPRTIPHQFRTVDEYLVGDDQALVRIKGVARYLLQGGMFPVSTNGTDLRL